MIKTYTAIPSNEKHAVSNMLVCEPSNQQTPVKGLIQIVHGMTEHIDRYEAFAEYFTTKGFVVFGNDIISHGRSSHDKAYGLYIENWENAVADITYVKDIMRKKYPDTPIILLGFSLGSFLVRSMTNFDDYAGQILIGTGYQPSAVLNVMRFYLMTKYKKHMSMSCDEIKALAFDSYNKKFKGLPENYWLLTSEKARFEYKNDHFINTDFTPQFFCEFLKGMTIANHNLKSIPNIKTMFLYGEKDPVTDFGKGIKKVYQDYKKHNDSVLIFSFHDKTHDILHDIDNDKVYDKIEEFAKCVCYKS